MDITFLKELIAKLEQIVTQEDEAQHQEELMTANYNDRRFDQIEDLIPDCGHCNDTDAKYATIDSVTVDAGGGWNGPKHPADIRGDSVSMYPEYKFKDYVQSIEDEHKNHTVLINNFNRRVTK